MFDFTSRYLDATMFFNAQQRAAFEQEVRIEVEFLKKLHGDDPARIAAEKASRPTNRTFRRKVLEEAARRLSGKVSAPSKGFLRKLLDRR